MEQFTEDIEEKYRSLTLKTGIIISFTSYFLYLIFYILYSASYYINAIYSLAIQLVIFITLYVLLLKGKYNLTRRLFIYLSIVFIYGQALLISGPESGVQYYLLIFSLLSFSIIDTSKTWISFFFFFITISLFSSLEFHLLPDIALIDFPERLSRNIRIISITSTLSIVYYISYLFFRINIEKSKLITSKTKELLESNSKLEKSKKMISKQNKKVTKLNEALQTNIDLISYQKKELEKSNSDKDKLFSIIAHDLKNPISALIGLSEVMQMNLELYSKDRIKILLKQINDSANRINILLINLLNWARSQTGQIKPKKTVFCLCEVLDDNKKLFKQNLKEKKIELSVFCPTNTMLHADKNMIDTVIRNLLSNAIKFTYEEGSVKVLCEKEGNRTILKILDSGVGMTKFTIDRLFNTDTTFSTTGTNNEQGMGLGLLICKDFLKLNDCELLVESQPDKGSMFTIIFPEFEPDLN